LAVFLPQSRRWVRRAVLASFALAVAGSVVAFLQLGRFMAAEDPLEKADAIFVFSGTRVERPLEAFDLYREGYAPRVVVTRAVAEQAMFLAERRGIRVASDFDLNREVLRQLGLPDSALMSPDRIHDNTAQEAQTLRALATQNHWRKVILVSSKYHLRRLGLACSREMKGTGVQLIRRGSRYDQSTPERWWRRRSDIRWLLSEVPKLVAYELGLGA
jgi:uncharacterized SAM-binding protein YcdF (DUF218 family)